MSETTVGMDMGKWATTHLSLSFQATEDNEVLEQTCEVPHAASPGSGGTVENSGE